MPSVGISPHDICNERVFRSLAGFGKPKGLVHDPCLVAVKSQKFVTWGVHHDYESMNWTEAFFRRRKNNQILDLKKLQFISNLLIKRKVNPGAGGYKLYDCDSDHPASDTCSKSCASPVESTKYVGRWRKMRMCFWDMIKVRSHTTYVLL